MAYNVSKSINQTLMPKKLAPRSYVQLRIEQQCHKKLTKLKDKLKIDSLTDTINYLMEQVEAYQAKEK